MNIAILGAPGTGKTALALALRIASNAANPLYIHDGPSLLDSPRQWDLVLLMGLDLPAPAAAVALRQPVDQQLRALLAHLKLPHATVYGQGPQREQHALQAIQFHQREPSALQSPPSRWRWPCEKCSDPECEHRLFSSLLQGV
jgi:hypothetical protein